MKRLSVATHIAMALSLTSASVLLIAHSIGLVPDPRAAHVQARETITDLLARSVVEAAGQRKYDRVEALAKDLAARDPDIISIGLRLADGTLVATTPGHEDGWKSTSTDGSASPRARVPILRDGDPFAEVEIRFRELNSTGIFGLITHPLAPLILFCACAGFLSYRLYLRRVLNYLDPTSVIPERVRLLLDSLVEGVMLLDTKERIVLINRAFAKLCGSELEALIGKPASSFTWVDRSTNQAPIPPPWVETIEDGALRAGIRLELHTDDQRKLPVNVSCAPIAAANGRRRGVAVTLIDQTETESQRSEMEVLLRSLASSHQEIAHKNKELTLLATTDPLTECFNRRALFERADQCWIMSRRSGTPLCCVMLDIDHFKSVNDKFGHQTGDQVLRRVGAILRDTARGQDIPSRYGGEEFCLILPETNAAAAKILAERLRRIIESEPIVGIQITASLGIADNTAGEPTIEQVLANADQALYAAKHAGRNRVEVFERSRGRDAA